LSGVYWVGEAQGDADDKDVVRTPKVIEETTAMFVSNAARLARLLTMNTYPGLG
jgi:hypothetical protein